jgi:pimeloyl-ACP methyl ester carboxylesterase
MTPQTIRTNIGFLFVVTIIFLFSVPVFAQTAESSSSLSTTCTTRTGLYCERYGKGDPIVALHGLGGNIYTWRELKGKLPNNELFLIDLRGAGKSPKPHDKHYSILEQADLIYDFIQEKDLRNLTVLGNSYGGAVSLLVAIKLCKTPADRGRLSKLILIDSGGYNESLPWHLKLMRTPVLGWMAVYLLPTKMSIGMVLRDAYFRPRNVTKEQIRAYAKPISARGGRHALLQTARQAIPRNINEITAQYKDISVPTLILWGDADHVIPLKIGMKLDDAIPDSKLVLIPQAGHIPQEERPVPVICAIRKFLEPEYVCIN